MAATYSWRGERQGPQRKRRSGSALIWLWGAVAVSAALLAHLVFLVFADQITLTLGLARQKVLETDYFNLQRVVVEDEPTYVSPLPEEQAPAPPDSAKQLLDELAALEELPDETELDIRVDVEQPDLSVKMTIPALDGDALASALDEIKGPEVTADLKELGSANSLLKESQNGRVIIDSGLALADEFDPDELTREMARKGLDALSKDGIPEGYTSLDELLALPGNSLEGQKGMIGSDLLFEFNSAQLRDSARLSLMKVAMLIDRNPDMFCWIEGHTDTIGSDEANLDLSRRRAQSVKDWLTAALGITSEKIKVIPRGEAEPLVEAGDQNAQALNRRVEVKMRKSAPRPKPQLIAAKPVLVKPQRPAPRAIPVEEPPATPEPEPEEVLTTDSPEVTQEDPFESAPPPIKAVAVDPDELEPEPVPIPALPAEPVEIPRPPLIAVPVQE